MSPTLRSLLRYGALALALATALGFGSAARMMVLYHQRGTELAFGEALSTGLLDWALWLPFAPVVVFAARRVPIARGRLLARLLLHLGLSTAVSAAQLAAFAAVTARLRGTPLADSLPSAFLVKFHAGVFVYWTLLLGVQAWLTARRARDESVHRARLGEQLANARLAALHAHLRPHFLFNTLNSIAALTRRDPDGAERMIARLGALLRRTIDSRDAQEVALEEELAFLADYVAIEQARFGERLEVQLCVQPEARGALVPPLLLQTLVENAIHHGIAPRVAGGRVTVSARAEEGRVRITVSDDGEWADEAGAANGPGLGLASTRERLRLLYGDEGRCDVRTNGGGTEVAVALPWRDRPGRAPDPS